MSSTSRRILHHASHPRWVALEPRQSTEWEAWGPMAAPVPLRRCMLHRQASCSGSLKRACGASPTLLPRRVCHDQGNKVPNGRCCTTTIFPSTSPSYLQAAASAQQRVLNSECSAASAQQQVLSSECSALRCTNAPARASPAEQSPSTRGTCALHSHQTARNTVPRL